MAALPETLDSRLVDLRKISGNELGPALEEETALWRDALDWDLRPATDLVRRFVDMQALNGFVLLEGARPVGYSYYIRDSRKGLIGDLYVMAKERTPEREHALLEATLEALWRFPGVHRVESQLLLFGANTFGSNVSGSMRHPFYDQRRLPFANRLHTYPRKFMELPASKVFELREYEPVGVSLAPWSEARQDESARLVAAAYRGHVDSDINDQYRSPGGARRFLNNIVQYPGCGTFFGPASFAALDVRGALCGISLTSLVASDTGHITQICVAPSHRDTGVGYALMRRSLLALVAHGCQRVSLTVTSANLGAIRLYEGMGFTERRGFAAFVWDS